MLQSVFAFASRVLRLGVAVLSVGYLLAFPTLLFLAKVAAKRQEYADHKWEKLLWRWQYTRRKWHRSSAPRVRGSQ
jgi:hypothetical protein